MSYDLEKGNKEQEADNGRANSFDDHTLRQDADIPGLALVVKERDATEAPITPPEDANYSMKDSDFPDGGLEAWLVVLGLLMRIFYRFGYVNTWGAFQDYYEHQLLQDTTPSTIAWIGSIQYSLNFFPAILIGRMFDLGYFKVPLFCASILLVVCTFLTAECTKYWHFLLCQGFGIGIACGIIFGPTVGIISHWFKKRRGTALGIMACGSSLGGTIFPIAFRQLETHVGFKWTMRTFGFILIFFTAVSNLTLKRRLPPVYVSGGLFNFRVFTSAPFSAYTAGGFIAFLGLYTVLTYIDASASTQGIDENFAFYLVSIANAASGFGRLGFGFCADRIGAMNVMTPMTALAGVFTYIWPFVHGRGPLVVIAIFYGISSGAYVSLLGAPMIAFGEPGDVGRRTGMFMTTMSIGALAGPPISGAINTATGNYKAVGIYAGSAIMVATVLMALTRHLVLKGPWGKF
ncbi:MFS general substrate transporter [Dentipellis sp. KUC8613]|nr:MFS general substrate transporter [Dentipellis sp. KUC8613]